HTVGAEDHDRGRGGELGHLLDGAAALEPVGQLGEATHTGERRAGVVLGTGVGPASAHHGLIIVPSALGDDTFGRDHPTAPTIRGLGAAQRTCTAASSPNSVELSANACWASATTAARCSSSSGRPSSRSRYTSLNGLTLCTSGKV